MLLISMSLFKDLGQAPGGISNAECWPLVKAGRKNCRIAQDGTDSLA